MRKTGGYMTVEVSALLPIILMVLWMFFSYLFYFMNCGIAQGIMEEAVQKVWHILCLILYQLSLQLQCFLLLHVLCQQRWVHQLGR